MNQQIKAIAHASLAGIVLVLLLVKTRYLKIVIKIWSLIPIIGGLLVLLGMFLFWIGDAPEKIDIYSAIRSLIHILIGVLIFSFCDESIEITTPKKRENKS